MPMQEDKPQPGALSEASAVETPQVAAAGAKYPLFHRMSGGAQRLILRQHNQAAALENRRAAPLAQPRPAPTAPHALGTANVRVNPPAEDIGEGDHTANVRAN